MFSFVSLLTLLLTVSCARSAGEDKTPIDLAVPPTQAAPGSAQPIHWTRAGYQFTITPAAAYTARGHVLSTARYWSGWSADLSPVDLAIGWGELITSNEYKKVDWSQSNRWYWFRYQGDFEHDNTYITTQSANTHIIPANVNLARAVKAVDEGDNVELSGYLVRIEGTQGEEQVTWNSSLSRDDTGNGSCEVLYLIHLKVDGQIYE